jgi:plastocyanin/lysophospholipase L1-like esterase
MLSRLRIVFLGLVLTCVVTARGRAQIPLQPDDTVVFYGNSMVERLLEQGELQAWIHLSDPAKKLHFRSFAWTGDEVGHRLRAEGYADHMKSLLALWPARCVVVGYGMNEAFAGPAGLAEFRSQLGVLLDQLARLHPGARFVLLSPTAVEAGGQGRDAAERNRDVALYSAAIAEAAVARGALFVDLFAATQKAYAGGVGRLTGNGLHLNESGNRAMARVIASAFVGEAALARVEPARLREVASAAGQLAHDVAEVVRPKNGILYYGQRKRAEEREAEIPLYLQRIEKDNALVHQIAASPTARFADAPFIALAPLPVPPSGGSTHSVGTVKSAAEMQAGFQIADGYALNLFASEEQFPDLRAPVQIAFDARGRLWVVTMPSFPHTVPGQPQEDKLIVLEDTDHDGKADRLTVFAEGFDALDGVAFTAEGVLVSEQSRHWLLRDTDGDGRADSKREMLRGLDLTDSHHGGMMATDPVGAVWFCDGVFHRSQLETPHGVVRGVDSTTYRLNPRNGRIEPEWQSITPNPWKVTFDRTGNIFQMYGDGLVLDGLPLTWTPLGVYHPFAYAQTIGYGKGSAAASISSPNFPEEYQQGMASAACIGPYVVSLTKYDFSQGMVRSSGRLDLVSSKNAAFRPVDVEFGFDGALYVSDFSSAIIGHAQHPMRDVRWNHVKGRIWRVVNQVKPVVKDWPRIEGATTTELLALLLHPQDIVRKHVRLELRRQGESTSAAVDAWALQHLDDDQAVLEAVFVQESFGKVRPVLLAALMKSKSPLHRAAAVRMIRYQADRLPNAPDLLHTLAADPHPRVQMEVVDAVAHLRPTLPAVEHALHGLHSTHGDVQHMLSDLRHGTRPFRGRSVPVLEMAPGTRVRHWQWQAVKEPGAPLAFDAEAGGGAGPGAGIYRTFLRSDVAQPASLMLKHGFLDVALNGVQLLSHDSQWSSEQQVQLELQAGLNVIEVEFRRIGARPPSVYLFDPLGQPLSRIQSVADAGGLAAMASAWDQMKAAGGDALVVRAAPGLQFVPRELRVKAGAKVRLVFENPDLMTHNLILVEAGAADEVGALADLMAADPNGMAKGYLPVSKKILHATPLVNPKGKFELKFTAPIVPGRYPYLCTFPGHWRIMRGELVVE